MEHNQNTNVIEASFREHVLERFDRLEDCIDAIYTLLHEMKRKTYSTPTMDKKMIELNKLRTEGR